MAIIIIITFEKVKIKIIYANRLRIRILFLKL